MDTRQLSPARVAVLLLGISAFNLAITAFVAFVAIRDWNELPELRAEVSVFEPDGSPSAKFEAKTPRDLAAIGDSDFVQAFELDGGSRAEVRVPRSDLERLASASNMHKLMQIASPLVVSILFLAAGLRLRKSLRSV